MKIEYQKLEDGSFPPIVLDMPPTIPDGWKAMQAQAALELILRAFRCRKCKVFKDSQVISQAAVAGDPPQLRSYYPSPNDSQLIINFICPRSNSYHRKFACSRPHTIIIPKQQGY